MAQPDKSHIAGGPWRTAEWIVPLSVSLCLHLLLLGMLVIWHDRPREIIWVNLFEANLLPAKIRESDSRPQVAKTPPSQRPTPPSTSEHQRVEQSVKASAARPELPFAAPQPVLPTVTGRGAVEHVATDAMTGEVESFVLPTTADTVAAEPLQGPAETVEQRYLREQFAYIRERVMARLVYPPLARRQGWVGHVQVEFTVCADGSVEGLRIAATSGRSLLDRQALLAVQAAAPFPAPPAPANIILPVLFTVESSHR